MKALKRGSSGKQVRKLQKRLGFPKSKRDGEFGPKTEKAVEDFQRKWNRKHPRAKHKLTVDGVVGPLTWKRLFPVASRIPLTKRPAGIIVLEIGHGMNNVARGRFDPGATAGRRDEHTWATLIVKKLKRELEKRGRVVRIIQDKHVTKRDDVAAGFKPVIVASNHLNAGGGTGPEVLVSRKAGRRIRRQAERIVHAIAAATGLKDRGVKLDVRGLAIFKLLPQKTVLIEWGFIDSKKDRKKLKDTKAKNDPIDVAVDAVASVLATIE